MEKKFIHPECSPVPAGPYTPAVIGNGFVFLSGQTPEKPGTDEIIEGDINVQARQVFENIQGIIAASGCTMKDIIKVNAYLVNMNDFGGFNEVYRQFFSKPYPARTTVKCDVAGDCLLEVDVIALLPDNK